GVVDDLGDPAEPGVGGGDGAWILGEVADLTREVLPELADGSGVGEDHQAPGGSGIPRRAEETPGRELAARVLCGGLVVDQLLDDRAPQVFAEAEGLGVVLLETAAGIVLFVLA